MRRVQLKIEGDICGGIQKQIPIGEILLKESELKERPPPRMAKAQLLYTEPYIDYSDSQVIPSDNGFYVDPTYPADFSV